MFSRWRKLYKPVVIKKYYISAGASVCQLKLYAFLSTEVGGTVLRSIVKLGIF